MRTRPIDALTRKQKTSIHQKSKQKISKKLISVFAAATFALSLFAVGLPFSATAGHNADGLVGYRNLDEGAGSDAFDTSSHSNDGALTNGPTWGSSAPVPGSITSLDFDGSNDHVLVADDSELDLEEAISISFWFLLEGNSGDNDFPRAVSKGQTTTTDGAYGVFIKDITDPEDIGFRFIDQGGTTRDIRDTSLPNYFDSEWHHVVVTYSNDDNEGNLYFDGSLETTVAIGGNTTIRTTSDDLTIGAGLGDANRHFPGHVDEVRIYDRALALSEVEALNDYSNFGLSLSPDGVMNEVGSEHTVTATLDPALANIPILFEVSGANEGPEETVLSNGDGEAVFTYVGNNAGPDEIAACIDLEGDGDCNGDDPFAVADKTWFARYFVTGGGAIKAENGKKNAWSFGGNVGLDDFGDAMGQLQITNHGDKDSCHFDTFSNLTFDGDPTTSPDVDVNTATFTANGMCQKFGPAEIMVVMVDNAEPGAGVDTIEVSGDLEFGPGLDTGNIQVHPPEIMVGADSDAYVAPAECDLTVASDGTGDHLTIQAAIDAASGGEVICVADGEYEEFVVDKGVTIAGLTNPVDGSAKVSPSDPSVIDLALVEASDVTITGLLFDAEGVDFTGHQTAGVRVSPSGGDIDNVHITFNVIQNLAATSATASNKGIQWHDGASSGDPVVVHSLTNSSFANNVIDNITSDSKGAYGIQTVGDMDSVSIHNNTISNIDGAWGAGVALDSHEVDESLSDATVMRNHIMDGIWEVPIVLLPLSVQIEHNVDQTGIAVNENNIEGLVHGGGGTLADPPEVNAENNWWGDDDPSDDFFGPVDYMPFSTSAFVQN